MHVAPMSTLLTVSHKDISNSSFVANGDPFANCIGAVHGEPLVPFRIT